MPVLTDGDDGVMRVLISLRGRFLYPKASFGSSGIGLLEAIWPELCLVGDRVGVVGV